MESPIERGYRSDDAVQIASKKRAHQSKEELSGRPQTSTPEASPRGRRSIDNSLLQRRPYFANDLGMLFLRIQ